MPEAVIFHISVFDPKLTADQAAAILGQTRFDQMAVNESIIARAWLLAHWHELDRVDFNANLGNAIELGPEFDATTKRQAAILSQKRADIIAYHGDEATIVEVKTRLSFSALGQLLGYQLLFELEHPEIKKVNLVAIGHSASIDTAEVLQAHGVHLELFPNVTLMGVGYSS